MIAGTMFIQRRGTSSCILDHLFFSRRSAILGYVDSRLGEVHRLPVRLGRGGCLGRGGGVPVPGELSSGAGHERRRALRAAARSVDRRHLHGPMPGRKPGRVPWLRPCRVAPWAPEQHGPLRRHRQHRARVTGALRAHRPGVQRPHGGAHRGQRFPHAPGAGTPVLRLRPARGDRESRGKLPHHPRRPRRSGLLPLLRRPAPRGPARGGQGEASGRALLPDSRLLATEPVGSRRRSGGRRLV
jgi:hypothetical protein